MIQQTPLFVGNTHLLPTAEDAIMTNVSPCEDHVAAVAAPILREPPPNPRHFSTRHSTSSAGKQPLVKSLTREAIIIGRHFGVVSEPRLLWNSPLTHAPFMMEYPNLGECTCSTELTAIRSRLEEQVIRKAERWFPDKSSITVFSLGPGKCAQELAYLIRLYKAGYQKIRLDLVDNFPDTKKSLFDLQKFCIHHLQGCEIDFCLYESFEHYHRRRRQFPLKDTQNVFLMIDVDNVASPGLCGSRYALYTGFEYLKNHRLLPEGSLVAFTTEPETLEGRHSATVGRFEARFSRQPDEYSKARIVHHLSNVAD